MVWHVLKYPASEKNTRGRQRQPTYILYNRVVRLQLPTNNLRYLFPINISNTIPDNY